MKFGKRYNIHEFEADIKEQLLEENEEKIKEINDIETILASETMSINPMVFAPKNYKDLKPSADYLIKHHVVLVDFNQVVSSEERRRIIDFFSGITYALNGKCVKEEKLIYKFYF